MVGKEDSGLVGGEMVGVEEGDVPVEEMVEEGEDNPDDRIEA